jgi:hypothetical protein
MQPVRTSAATEVLAGLVERVTFHNAENGFSESGFEPSVPLGEKRSFRNASIR